MTVIEDIQESAPAVAVVDQTNEQQANDENKKSNTKIKKVYIANVDYSTTDDELYEFIKTNGFECTEVLIPSHTIKGIRKLYSQSFGIAYAEFSTAADANTFIDTMNHCEFKNRKLEMRLYSPFSPSAQRPRRKRGADKPKNQAVLTATTVENDKPEKDTMLCQANTKPKNKSSIKNRKTNKTNLSEEEVSATHVYVARFDGRVTEEELRELFAKYAPKHISVFKVKSYPRGLHLHKWNLAAIVELSKFPDSDAGDDNVADYENSTFAIEASKEFNKYKLLENMLTVKPSYVKKIKTLKKAADLESAFLEKQRATTTSATTTTTTTTNNNNNNNTGNADDKT